MTVPAVADRADLDLETVANILRDSGIETSGRLRLNRSPWLRGSVDYILRDATNQWILRHRRPSIASFPAWRIAREVRVQRALAAVEFAVPRIVVAPGPPMDFYVRTSIDGLALRSSSDLACLPPSVRWSVGMAYIDALADLHRTDPAAVGLTDFGRPIGFLDRQLARWSKHWAAAAPRPVRGMEMLATLLAANMPTAAPAAVIHGNFRPENVVFDPDTGRVRAILDWSMSTVGDPLTDLGTAFVFWEGLADSAYPPAVSPGTHPGYPSWDELLQRYVRHTGRSVDGFRWYQAFAYFRLAVMAGCVRDDDAAGDTVTETLVERGLSLMLM
ncbi:phosphotransferase family protein [Nocardia elegans]|uniref:phosphotransferase family protein n=1 Tax=Nocardia elegans TaxID=300029 RepID=UPI0018959CCA|nr:phosphotransferase family protein [Nocardia elegans]MBF6451134.1 phosphotransferase family protein [Nocardia elegans]